MTESDDRITKTVQIEVPPDIEDRARERASGDEDVEVYLLDEFYFEYEWQLKGDK